MFIIQKAETSTRSINFILFFKITVIDKRIGLVVSFLERIIGSKILDGAAELYVGGFLL